MSMTRAAAEVIGLKALGWLAGNEDLLPTFLGATGASEMDLKQRIEDAEFLGSVLDFILMDDAWVLGFCEVAGLPDDTPFRARMSLPGGEQVHWT